MLDALTPESIAELSKKHGMPALWPEPHIKARTGGSDDHGLFNIGRTWTEFRADVKTVEQILECLRTARCRPGGEALLRSAGIHPPLQILRNQRHLRAVIHQD